MIATSPIDTGLDLVRKYKFSLIPCEPKGKGPLRGAKSRVNTEEGVKAFAAQFPNNINYGICSDETYTILETDDRERLVSLLGRPIPASFCVSARPNRGYWIFRQTPETLALKKNPTVPGLFEWRHVNEYCIGPGSIHPDTEKEYRNIVDMQPTPVEAWLHEGLLKLHRDCPVSASGTENAPDEDACKKLRALYLQNLDPEDMMGSGLYVTTGRHGTMLTVSGWLHDGHREDYEALEFLKRLWDDICSRDPRGGEAEGIIDHTWKGEPCEFTLNDGHPALEPYAVVGLTVYQTKEAYEKDRPAIVDIPVVDENGSLRYPIEVWDGTDYAEFARRGTKDNFIPPEFFVESLKTYVGAVAGGNMLITNERSGRPRFYTILLAGPGTGKNTAIDCTHDLFRIREEGGLVAGTWPKDALIWYSQHREEHRTAKRIGACRMKMSSASGLARSLPRLDKDGKVCNNPQERLLVVYTELAEMFEKLGIEGSGAAMMSALCDLYDGEEFVVPALADNDSFGGHLRMSILAGIQPRKWDIVCAGKGIEGSGFDERINLIPTTNVRTVASLNDPNFEDFKDPFLSRLAMLEVEPYLVKATAEAKAYANDEYQKLKPKDEEGVSAGRLNVLAWRNALHYSWLVGAPVVDVDAVGRGMKLARYQLEVRKLYKPLTGDNATARAANAIWRWMLKKPIGEDIKLRELERAVHADRLGGVFDSALALLAIRGRTVSGDITVETPGGSHKSKIIRRLESD